MIPLEMLSRFCLMCWPSNLYPKGCNEVQEVTRPPRECSSFGSSILSSRPLPQCLRRWSGPRVQHLACGMHDGSSGLDSRGYLKLTWEDQVFNFKLICIHQITWRVFMFCWNLDSICHPFHGAPHQSSCRESKTPFFLWFPAKADLCEHGVNCGKHCCCNPSH